MFIEVMIDGKLVLINSAHIYKVERYFSTNANDQREETGCTLFMAMTPGFRLWVGDDYETICKKLANKNQ